MNFACLGDEGKKKKLVKYRKIQGGKRKHLVKLVILILWI